MEKANRRKFYEEGQGLGVLLCNDEFEGTTNHELNQEGIQMDGKSMKTALIEYNYTIYQDTIYRNLNLNATKELFDNGKTPYTVP